MFREERYFTEWRKMLKSNALLWFRAKISEWDDEEILSHVSKDTRIRELERMLTDLVKYPPSPEGVPILPAKDLLIAYDDIVREIEFESGMVHGTTESVAPVFMNTYYPVIINIISYVHLLPASEHNHHSEVGGLLRHSFEVGLNSLRRVKRRKPEPIGLVDIEKLREPRWQFAAFLTGMLHDIGKVVGDIHVHGHNTGTIWNAHCDSIYTWATRHGETKYTVEWMNNRRSYAHEHLNATMLKQVLTPFLGKWLFEKHDDLSGPVSSALLNYGKQTGYLEDAVRVSDATSAEMDLRSQWHRMMGQSKNSAQESIVDAMRELKSTRWRTINEPQSLVFVVDDDVYLKYPECIQAVMSWVNKGQPNRLPQDVKSIHGILENSNLVLRNHEQASVS
ncbi:MobH family relaxase, partial [Enterovibrio norvegicus]|uniref:MobH family relaxase n=1 Tax=Enterovibrio norvegicus TaxID=188144 RepID=UPI00352C04DD